MSDNTQFENEENSVDLNKLFTKFFDKWKLFLISIIIFLFIGFLYIKYTSPKYDISARILINDDTKSGGVSGKSSSLMDLSGIIGSSNSVDNEAEILKTRFLMEQVVRQMQLNIVYNLKAGLRNYELYESPFKVNIKRAVDTIKTTKIQIESLGRESLKVVTKGVETEVKFNQDFTLKGVGILSITRNPSVPLNKELNYQVYISSIDERVAQLRKALNVVVSNKQVTVIDLKLSYPLQRKGEDILNAIIKRYIASNLEDKNIIADSTTKFIQNRLSIIATELGDVETKQEQYKQKNQLADMTEQSKLLVQNTAEFRKDLAKAETQVSVVNDLEAYLMDEKKNKRVFPTSLLPSDMVFSDLMNQYNSLLIERDKLLVSETEQSPFIKNIDQRINGLRQGILSNVQSTKNTFVLNRNKLRSQLNQIEGKIGEVPQIEKNYLKIARNQQIKQELYIFLMQKAEETAISKTANISRAKIIDPPKSEVIPTSPKKNIILLGSLLFGLFVPVIIVIISDLLNRTISTKEDIIRNTTVPVIGEISHNDFDDNLIVANKGRSAISEQFRALRTNLSFYLKTKDEKVVLLTSSKSGEGKSFTAINLGNILALAGKKVLLMELDLRKPGLSAKLGVNNDIGFSNFTINHEMTVSQIIKPLSINENMYIISSGPLPPNPAETLMSERMPVLISELKKQFDYIIMDAPPIGIITDAQLLASYADATLYLVRQKVTQKEQLTIVQDLYNKGKMKNLGIVVNDIISKYYGYGYGYGSYGDDKNESWFKNLFNRR